MKKLGLVFFILLAGIMAIQAVEVDKATKGSITGRIVDEAHLALPGASIFVVELNMGASSDANGYYRISAIAPGKYTIEVRYIGYEKEQDVISIEAGVTKLLNFTMKEGIELREVVVSSFVKGQNKAINQQKNSLNITNIVSADQVGRFPDANIGDALKRVSGINVQYDQGEARFGHIRGTSPELNSVTINGERIPSAEAETRAIQLDLVPADMIQTIEVNKVVTPEMDADAIGGSINLVTRSNPYKRRISATVGSGYNQASEKWQSTAAVIYGERFNFNSLSSLGMLFSISYDNQHLASDNFEAEWEDEDGEIFMSDYQVRTYELQRERQSYSAAFDYQISPNHKLDFKAIYNHRKDWENRYRLRYKGIERNNENNWQADIYRQTKGGSSDNKNRRLEDQQAMNFSLSGIHNWGKLSMDWSASYSKASEDRPNERYITFRAKEEELNINTSNTKKPYASVVNSNVADLSNDYGLKELTEELQYTDEKDKSAKINFELPWLTGKNANKLKWGFRYKGKEKMRNNEFFEYEPTNEDDFVDRALAKTINKTKTDFMAGDYVSGSFVDEKFLGGLNFKNSADFEKSRVLEEESGNFEAEEDIFAGYFQIEQNFGEKWTCLAGLRIEQTEIEYSGRDYIEGEEEEQLIITPREKNSYTNVLPAFIAKLNASKDFQIKLAWTNTIARPKYFDLAPHSEVKMEDLEISIGNSTLKPTLSMNFDLMGEYYFKSIGLFSGGVFYKNISDFIVDQKIRDFQYGNTLWDKFSQPINGGDARLWGVELAFQRKLDFLPGFLRHLGLYTNYTYTHSEVKNFKMEDRENETLDLPGTPRNIFNASLVYEMGKLTLRSSFNYADNFIDEFGKSAFYDRFYDKVYYLDFNSNYALNKFCNIYIEVNNILNQPLRYYQGTEKFTMQTEYYGVKLNFGVKFNF